MRHIARRQLGIRGKATIFVILITTLGLVMLATAVIVRTRERISIEEHTHANSSARALAVASELPLAVGDVKSLSSLLERFIQSEQIVFAAVYSDSGVMLAHAVGDGSTWENNAVAWKRDSVILGQADVMLSVDEDELFSDYDGDTRSTQPHALGRVVIGFSTAPMHAAQSSQTRMTLVMVVIVGFFSSMIALWVTGKWARRLGALVNASERISAGDLGQPLHDRANDEIGRLTHSFERMRESVERRDLELRDFNTSLQEQVGVRTADLALARDVAEDANRSKSEFLANMSHEIRTPMTAILGYADLLMNPDQPEKERRDCVETIERNGRHLLMIINDILDISKIESGRMTIEKIRCSPAKIVAEVESLMQVRAADAGISLEVCCGGPIPETVLSDPTRLRQIIVNLVGNAIKFTQQGGVRVVLNMDTDANAESPRLRLDVADTGVGISPDQIDKLFKAFNQADASTTRKFGGTGLGLAISRSLARMLGGNIIVTSKLGEGSVFSVTIETGPLDGVRMISSIHEVHESTSKKKPVSAGAVQLTCRILLAEDGPDNQRLISFHLRKAGAQVTIAENGRIAVDLAMRALEGAEPFDLILMDMQMPELDGYGASRELRQRGYTGPIIALTAHAMEGDREKCIEAGCDEYQTKPINRAALLGACYEMLTSRRAA